MNGHHRQEPEKPPLQGLLFPQKVLAPTRPSKKRAAARRPGGAVPWTEPLPVLHPRLRLGLCSFTDPDWRGTFYREEESDLLRAYSDRLSVVEVDSTFYGIPRASVIDSWVERTPPSFRFALKFPREITHERGLEKTEYVTRAFLDVAARLGERLGPFLLQFPYSFRATRFVHLASYLEKLPKEHRYVVEIRHRSWLSPAFFQLLEEHNVAFCLIDHPFLPRLERRTSDFFYVRWLGDRRDITGPFQALKRDPTSALRWWARRLWPLLESGHEVYAFANNYFAGHAPETLKVFAEVFWKNAPFPRSAGNSPL